MYWSIHVWDHSTVSFPRICLIALQVKYGGGLLYGSFAIGHTTRRMFLIKHLDKLKFYYRINPGCWPGERKCLMLNITWLFLNTEAVKCVFMCEDSSEEVENENVWSVSLICFILNFNIKFAPTRIGLRGYTFKIYQQWCEAIAANMRSEFE